MRWLFIAGVSADLAGAITIAAAVLWRTPAEIREEASGHWGTSLRVILLNEREQTQAWCGVGLLATGFVLQLLGYLAHFSGGELAGAAALSAAIILGGFFAARAVAGRKVPLRFSDQPRPDEITDERGAYHLATLDDVRTYRRLNAKKILDKDPQLQTTSVRATINDNRWLAECPNCAGSVMMVTPGIQTFVCLGSCGNEYPVVFPDDREAIEELLLRQPRQNRNWSGETLEELRTKLAQASPHAK